MRRILDSSMSSEASQSCRLSWHISYCPLSIHNSDLFQPRFLADGSFTKLSQIAFGDPPKCASKGEQFTDCLVTVLKRFMILSNTISKEGFGFSCAITMSSSLIVLISRLTRLVVLWSPTELNILLMFCSWQNSRTSLKIYPDPWSVLIVLGVPCKVKYFLRKFKVYNRFGGCARVYLRLKEFWKLVHLYEYNCFVPQVKGNGPAKSNSVSWFGSATDGSFPKLPYFVSDFTFHRIMKRHILFFYWA